MSRKGKSASRQWLLDRVAHDATMRDAIDRGAKHKEIAEVIGKPVKAVASRAARLGLASKWRLSATTERNDG